MLKIQPRDTLLIHRRGRSLYNYEIATFRKQLELRRECSRRIQVFIKATKAYHRLIPIDRVERWRGPTLRNSISKEGKLHLKQHPLRLDKRGQRASGKQPILKVT